MKITKDNLDSCKNKSDATKGIGKKILIYLLLIYAFALVAAIVFALQEENTVEHYFLFNIANKVVPNLSLMMYKLIVAVFVCGIIFGIFISGKKIRKKILSEDIEFKVSFDEEDTVERILRIVGRIITVLNLLFSLIITVFLYNKAILSYKAEMVMVAVCCGIIFLVLLLLFCVCGHLKVRFLINPITCVLSYVFYLVFLSWLIYLIWATVPMAFIELLKGVLLFFGSVMLIPYAVFGDFDIVD